MLELREQYPVFRYESYEVLCHDAQVELLFRYTIAPDLAFTHRVLFEEASTTLTLAEMAPFAFHVGLAEMFSYWKLTCSPYVEIHAGALTPEQVRWWHALFLKGMGEYYYKNHIDFTPPDFLTVTNPLPHQPREPVRHRPAATLDRETVMVPIGGGKDSAVTLEILQKKHHVVPLIVYPSTPASQKLVAASPARPAMVVRRRLDPQMIAHAQSGRYLNGHIPYSAALAFIFLCAACMHQIPYIAVSNERSAEEGNVQYLGHTINHQYSKTLEFERLFQDYIGTYLTPDIHFFSFLRPLNELQIGKLFATMPQYFALFRSCNRHQQQDSWCGQCPKCVSVALSLMPWLGRDTIRTIMGHDPLGEAHNRAWLAMMTDPTQVKPFECVVSAQEARACVEFIEQGQTPAVALCLAQWGEDANIPEPFLTELRSHYALA